MIIKVQKKIQSIISIIDQRQPSHTQRTSGISQVFWLQKRLSFHSKCEKKEEYELKKIKKGTKKTEELFSLHNWLNLHTFRSKCAQ